RQALTLHHHAESGGNFLAYAAAPLATEASSRKCLAVDFLAGVAVEAVAAQEILIGEFSGIRVLGNEKARGVPGGLTRGGLERGYDAGRALERKVVHQEMSQHSGRIA